MRKTFKTITLAITILTITGVIFIPHLTYAIDGPVTSTMNTLISNFANWLLGMTSVLVTATGTFLSISINLTTHIGGFFNGIPALKDVWLVVRNISSIFIIFVLLYSSIMTILGIDGTNIKSLIGKVIMVGLLINFSLFFVKVAIDASNIVSLQFYRAIAPDTSENFSVKSAFYDGGLSNVFMSSLKIPQIYQNSSVLKGADVGLSISFALVGGIIMMITAAFSFLAAAIAFTARTGLLLFLMALSPIFFAGEIFPQIKAEVSDKLLKLLKGQLIFMPAYLFLMYIALKLISSDGFRAIFNQSATGIPPASEGAIGPTFIGVIIQYVIALIFINAPLLFAIQLGAVGAKWAPDAKGISKWAGGIVGRNTAGRLGRKLGSSFDTMAANYQKTPVGRGVSTVLNTLGVSKAVRGGFTQMEKGKYGGTQNLEDIIKENKERGRVIAGVQRAQIQNVAINEFMNTHKTGATPTITQIDEFKKQVSNMDQKELEKTDIKILTNPKFASTIPTSKYEALLKSDSLTPQQQQDLRKARGDGLNEILTKNGADYLINTHMKGKPQDIAKLPSNIITKRNVVEQLDPAMLRKMVDENVSKADRDAIRAIIESYLMPTPGGTIDKSQRYLATNFVF